MSKTHSINLDLKAEKDANSSTLSDSSSTHSTVSSQSTQRQIKHTLKPIAEELRCTLSWNDLAYWIPLSAERRQIISNRMSATDIEEALATGDEYERGIPKPTIRKDGEFNDIQQ